MTFPAVRVGRGRRIEVEEEVKEEVEEEEAVVDDSAPPRFRLDDMEDIDTETGFDVVEICDKD